MRAQSKHFIKHLAYGSIFIFLAIFLLDIIDLIPSYWEGKTFYFLFASLIFFTIFVGWEIYQFETDDEIVDYVSPVGNSDVPYPVAFGENDVYFMLDKKLVKHDELETEVSVANAEDLYGEFYGHIGSKKKIAKLPMKNVVMLQKRLES